ncbi:hypothetical protein LY41_002461 [Prauserella halophila]|nr:hypothetical protein [Prauserella halophila]
MSGGLPVTDVRRNAATGGPGRAPVVQPRPRATTVQLATPTCGGYGARHCLATPPRSTATAASGSRTGTAGECPGTALPRVGPWTGAAGSVDGCCESPPARRRVRHTSARRRKSFGQLEDRCRRSTHPLWIPAGRRVTGCAGGCSPANSSGSPTRSRTRDRAVSARSDRSASPLPRRCRAGRVDETAGADGRRPRVVDDRHHAELAPIRRTLRPRTPLAACRERTREEV